MSDESLNDASLVQEFLTESRELIQKLDEGLVTLETASEDPELINMLFRALHTIKGTSSFFGYEQLVAVAHAAEDVLNLVRKGDLKVSREMIDTLLVCADEVKLLLDDVESGSSEKREIEPLLARLKQFQTPPKQGTDKAAPELTTRAMAPKLGEVLLAQGLISFEDLQSCLKEQAETGEALGKLFVRREIVSDAQIEKALAAQNAAREGKGHDSAMRVEVSKLDQLINLVGELVLERNRLLQLSRTYSDSRSWSEQFGDALNQSTARLSLLTEEIQSASLKTRMVPISVVFRRFPRIVRDVARSLGKEIELKIEGESTELDKTVVEEIADPMVHLVRNALDHGVEMPDARAQKGKPRCGTIQLDARQEGDHIIISIQDDGAGIDPARISAKAIEKGLVTPERVKTMSKTEILEMIFLPGFSTAEKVTDISGRGVGMDVVRSNIKKLNGTVEMDSQIGLGSTITLKLPLTLAILPVLLVKESGNAYGLPLRSVLETLRIERKDIHVVEGQEVVQLQDRVLPLVRLNRVLKTGGGCGDPDLMRIVILAIGERRIAVLVDEFIGQEQTVVKPLGSYLRRVPGLAGASISGDGRVRLVLDPAGIAGLIEQTVGSR